MSKASRKALFIVGVLCLVPFFYPTFRHTDLPNGKEDRFTMGLPMSPWLQSHTKEITEETRSEDGLNRSFNMAMTHDWSMPVLPWSWLLLVGGTMLLSLACKRRTAVTHNNE